MRKVSSSGLKLQQNTLAKSMEEDSSKKISKYQSGAKALTEVKADMDPVGLLNFVILSFCELFRLRPVC